MEKGLWTKASKAKWMEHLLLAVKLSVGCILSLVIAYELGVRYSATAGVITVLSIQKYKMETIRTAGKRLFAFSLALVIAWIAFSIFGFTTGGFGVFLFVFVFLCVSLEWEIALSVSVVLVTHLLEQGRMNASVLLNEFMVFGIGAGMGILMNLHLRRDHKVLQLRIEGMNQEFGNILHDMAARLKCPGRVAQSHIHFECLDEQIHLAQEAALANHQNSIRKREDNPMHYVEVRLQQAELLFEMDKRIGQLDMTPVQAEHIRIFLEQMAECYYRGEGTVFPMEELEQLFAEMRAQSLPVTREEFESRAILFVFLLHLKELLELYNELECEK